MPTNTVRIATRKSPLALWQAEYVRDALLARHPELKVQLVKMTTRGDRILDAPLAKLGGKGLFVKELETGLLEGSADIAVHSMKDVPVELPAGLHLAVICEREDPRDAFVSNKFTALDALPQGARVGTSSLRRRCQIAEHRPDLEITDLRGNVGTRLQKLDDGEYDAIILASAGLRRLGLVQRITDHLATEVVLPAIGQGAVGIECRMNDPFINDLLAELNHEPTQVCVRAERAFNERLAGGCQVPIAGYAELHGGALRFRGLVGRPDGSEILRDAVTGRPEDAAQLGKGLAEELLGRGAGAILKEVYAGA